ncbi:WD40-repeat-containing domain protein [Tirmania nivea]|nr:WD40-repeat-containing domain protein [Tirmania nivea]
MGSGREDSSHPPPLPLYVLRGHLAQINVIHFLRSNSRLLTGDTEGWAIMWKISSRRPLAVWKPHENAIIGLSEWGEDRVITHGRDNKLYVWKLGATDESGLSTALPAETRSSACGQSYRAPWLLHSLDTNSLNFCSFAMCYEHRDASANTSASAGAGTGESDRDSILIALPSALDSDSIDIMQLPSGNRLYSSIGMAKTTPTVVSSASQTKSGMAMSISLFYHSPDSSFLMLGAGFESGHVCLFGKDTSSADHSISPWQSLYVHKAHSQPVLSIATLSPATSPFTRKYIFSSSADSVIAKHYIPHPPTHDTSPEAAVKPPKTLTTHHTGQQSLVIRSDGKILATSGWDGKVRIYSTKSLKELAVLKWHKGGCYAVDFGYVAEAEGAIGGDSADMQLQKRETTVASMTVSAAREKREQERHWVAAGGKDGKVTLWEVY